MGTCQLLREIYGLNSLGCLEVPIEKFNPSNGTDGHLRGDVEIY